MFARLLIGLSCLRFTVRKWRANREESLCSRTSIPGRWNRPILSFGETIVPRAESAKYISRRLGKTRRRHRCFLFFLFFFFSFFFFYPSHLLPLSFSFFRATDFPFPLLPPTCTFQQFYRGALRVIAVLTGCLKKINLYRSDF